MTIPAPELSMVVVVENDSASFRLLLDHLQRQTMAASVELIVVTPSNDTFAGRRIDATALCDLRMITASASGDEGTAKAAGVAATRAPLVAFVEDHSYPDRRWVETMLEAHRREDLAAVGPVMANANPINATSWGCFLAFYSQWLASPVDGRVTHLPANQSCYRREVLLACGDRLPELLRSESVLHWELIARGHRLRLEPGAVTSHLNFSRLRPSVHEYLLSSRVFAAERAAGWSPLRRICYALGSPVLPALRTVRILRWVRAAHVSPGVVGRAMPFLLLVLSSGALGEMSGYAFGAGEASRALASFHASRHRLFSPRDLAAVTPGDSGGGASLAGGDRPSGQSTMEAPGGTSRPGTEGGCDSG